LSTTSVTFKTEDIVKAKAKEIFSTFGLDMSSGLNLLLHAVIREDGISFAVENKPSAEYVAWMKTKLEEALERRKDPDRKVYSEEEVKKMYGLA